ncbi:MAG: glycogen/starch synthase, partial [Candidatus Omnitrophota bacterium]
LGKDIEVFFIENDKYFNRDGLYGTAKGDHADNLERFSFYAHQTLELIKTINFKPDIIHCHDWQSALIPVYLISIYKDDEFFIDSRTVFTIHNLAYQGVFDAKEFDKIGIDKKFFNINGLEFYDKINLLKGALEFSDYLTTVSQTYSEEIQTKEFGCGLEGVLYQRRDNLSGIINGLDYSIWDPQKDNLIFEKYDADNLSGKSANKEKLQKEVGLPPDKNTPLLGMTTRLAEQKGMELVAKIIDKLMKLKLQIIILGTGEERYHTLLGKIAKKFPNKMSLHLKFDEKLAHKIYASSDIFLMPSRYEPCGLGQMISLKYGTIPLVFKTGGLADTIEDFDEKAHSGNGFVFDKYEPEELLNTIKRAIATFGKNALWRPLVGRAFTYDFSWDESAKKYQKLYQKLLHS